MNPPPPSSCFRAFCFNLRKFLDRCQEKNYKLNQDKLRFRLDEIKYHGDILTSKGLLPDPENSSIQEMSRPKDKTDKKNIFLGMIT